MTWTKHTTWTYYFRSKEHASDKLPVSMIDVTVTQNHDKDGTPSSVGYDILDVRDPDNTLSLAYGNRKTLEECLAFCNGWLQRHTREHDE